MFDVESVRSQFPILNQSVHGQPLVYFDNAATAQKPETVIQATDKYYREMNSNVHRGMHYLSQLATEAFEEARLAIRSFLNAPKPETVILTSGTTGGLNLLASCLGRLLLGSGDEVIITTMEHHSNIVPWQIVCADRGAKLRVLPIKDNGVLDESQIEFEPGKTKIVSFCHVSNSLGIINPVKTIIDRARRAGAVVIIDGAQGAAHLKIDVQALGCDFYVFSGHKVFGPTGIGALYGREDLLERMPPYQGGGEMVKKVSFEKTIYNELPFKFEAGTPNIAGAIGLAKAIEFMRALDWRSVVEHEQVLSKRLHEVVSNQPGVRIFGESPDKAPLVSFLIGNSHAYDLGVILDKLGIAIRTGHHCAQPLMKRLGITGTARASLAFYNTVEEIDRFGEALSRAARMLD